MPVKKKSSAEEKYNPETARTGRPKSRAEARGTLTEQEAEVIDEEEEEEDELSDYPEPTNRKRSTRQKAQSRKTTRRQTNKSSTHTVYESNDVQFRGFLGKDGIQFKTNEDGDPWCYFTLNVSQGKGRMPAFINVTVWDSDITEYLDANEEYLSGEHSDFLLVQGHWQMRKVGDQYYQGCVADHAEVVQR